MTGDKETMKWARARAQGLREAVDIALSIDSNRGNEKEIAVACKRRADELELGREPPSTAKLDPSTPIDKLPLSKRAMNCLVNERQYPSFGLYGDQRRLDTLGDLAKLTDSQLLRIINFGRGCLNEVRALTKKIAKEKPHA